MADFLNTTLNNRYTILERIGAGGMARVFKAKDNNLDRWVAVKVLHEHLSEDPTFSERFTREARLVASLNHPNIVQVYDYSSISRDGVPIYYMVMPLIEGDTLRAVLDRCTRQGLRLPRTQTIQIMNDVCSALAYAHEKGMAHRDIKPGNIILDSSGRAILTDFGIARMVESTRLTQDSVTTGTPAYMSPEQVNGQSGDARSDLYSLAVMFFEMWTGRLPYSDDSPASLLVKHLYAPIPVIEEATGVAEPDVDTILQKALAKEPEDRFGTAQDLAAALGSLKVNELNLPVEQMSALQPNKPRQPTPQPGPARFSGSSVPTGSTLPGLLAPGNNTTLFLRRSFSIGFRLIVVLLLLGAAALIVLQNLPREAQTSVPNQDIIPAIDPLAEFSQDEFTANFTDSDDDNRRFPVNAERAGVTRELVAESGEYRILNTNFPSAVTTVVGADSPYANVTITMVATLQADSASDAGYGIIFRYQDDDNYNVFAVDGLGRYSIWTRLAGQWRELERQDSPERWELNEYILPIGDANRLRINVTREALTLFVNNQRVTSPIVENTFTSGSIGIYVAAPDNGVADVRVDLFEAYTIIPSMTEPGRMG